jgi:hypothetical protein
VQGLQRVVLLVPQGICTHSWYGYDPVAVDSIGCAIASVLVLKVLDICWRMHVQPLRWQRHPLACLANQ